MNSLKSMILLNEELFRSANKDADIFSSSFGRLAATEPPLKDGRNCYYQPK